LDNVHKTFKSIDAENLKTFESQHSENIQTETAEPSYPSQLRKCTSTSKDIDLQKMFDNMSKYLL